MKQKTTVLLILIALISLFTGCTNSVRAEKINLDEVKYTIREKIEPAVGETLTNSQKNSLDGCADALLAAMETVSAEAYTFDFSTLAVSLGITEDSCEEYLLPKLPSNAIPKRDINAAGIWAIPSENGFIDDIKCLWINVYENLDGNDEYVIDISRKARKTSFELYTLRFVSSNGSLVETQNTLSTNYDGSNPDNRQPLSHMETGLSSAMYFSGHLNRTGIFELPALSSANMNLSLTGKPIEGNVPGGFAGMFEGTVTIDGYTNSLTADGFNIAVPIGMVDNPADYYIAFSKVSTANPQDNTGYRNVYFIKKDMSRIVGLYMTYKSAELNDWFELTRVSKASFDARVKEDNEKITALYSACINKAYGNRKEYNNALAVVYNMMIGVQRDYLEKNIRPMIADVSRDIRDYASAIKDENLARLGENGLYFFPNSRSMIVRLFSYDGQTAVAAIDFSSKQDDGYGGLYKASYENGNWTLEVIKDTRIKLES